MRRSDARAATAGLVLVAALLAAPVLLAPPAEAFWPFTRAPRPVLPDSTVQRRIEARYVDFKEGRDAAAVADSTDSTTTGEAPPGPGQGGVQDILRQRRYTMADAPPPPSPPADAVPPPADTLETSPSGPSGTPSDSLAVGAATDSVDAEGGGGPFPGLTGASGQGANAAAAAAAAAAALTRGFAPDLRSTFGSNNDYMRTNSDLSVTFTDPTGITLSSTLGYGVDISLNQNTDQRTSTINNSLNMPVFDRAFVVGVSTNNSRVTQEGTRTISNTATNNFQDTRGAEASVSAGRRLVDVPGLGGMYPALRGFGANLFYARRVGSNSRSTVAIQGEGAGETRHSDTGNSYGVGMAFDRFKWLSVRARAGTSRRSNKDKLSIDQPEDFESTSEGDTATVDVSVPKVGPLESVTLSFKAHEGSDTSVDLARSGRGGQTGVVGDYVLDTHKSARNTVNLSTRYRRGRLNVGLSGNVGKNSDSYEIRANAFNETRRYGWQVDSKLDFWKGAALVAKYEANVVDVNQDEDGTPNANSRRDDGRKIYFEASKPFTKTLIVKLFGEFQLDQAFYDHQGPQGFGDRDELRQRLGVDFSGAIGAKLKAQATLYLRTYDQAFIDPRRSVQSRNETEYVVRPSYSWEITPNVTLRQSFGLASKVLEEIFAQNRDTLNRNHFMRTEMDARLTDRLQMNLNWDYRLQDNGQYLSTPGSPERFYSPTVRTKTDGLGVGMRYAVLPNEKLTFSSRQEAQRLYSYGFTNGEQQLRSVTDSGNLSLGFESRFTLRDLKLDCRVYRNRSFNVSLNRRVYYNVDATLSYAF